MPNTLNRINALVSVGLLALVSTNAVTLDEVQDSSRRVEDRLRQVEDTVATTQLASTEDRLGTLEFHTRNALFASVPCDRPGGLCPIESDLDRRGTMVRQLLGLGSQDLSGVNLQAMNLATLDLAGVDLSHAMLDYADLSGATLDGADLRHASLIGANLTGASLQGALLVNADLTGAGLEGAILRGAQLQAATVEGAHLCNADLGEAELGGASLRGALLFGTDFSRTETHGDFLQATADEDTRWKGEPPTGLLTGRYEGAHGSLTRVLSYGPDAAPFLCGAASCTGSPTPDLASL